MFILSLCANLFFLLLSYIFGRAKPFCKALCSFYTCCWHFLTLSSSDFFSAVNSSQKYNFKGIKWTHLKGSQCSSLGPQSGTKIQIYNREKTNLLGTWYWSHFGTIFTLKSLFAWNFLNSSIEVLSKKSRSVEQRVWCAPALSPAPAFWLTFRL